ncbi:MAG: hypothetical protein ACI8WM_001520 [Burkholderiaceae bacterium]|jgi:hypothetical protein
MVAVALGHGDAINVDAFARGQHVAENFESFRIRWIELSRLEVALLLVHADAIHVDVLGRGHVEPQPKKSAGRSGIAAYRIDLDTQPRPGRDRLVAGQPVAYCIDCACGLRARLRVAADSDWCDVEQRRGAVIGIVSASGCPRTRSGIRDMHE